MGQSDTIPELLLAAQANAKPFEEQIAQTRALMELKDAPRALRSDLKAAIEAVERIAVDTFSIFESRMQNHFKRGPFSRKLKTLLTQSGRNDLADRFYKYYLVVNVLKHGKGASYRELVQMSDLPFIVNNVGPKGNADASQPLVDVSTPDFITGLTTTLSEAYDFLGKS